jgi:hypothetical protein
MDYLEEVSLDDIRQLGIKEGTYQGSWKKRGGVGAYMMVARKIDRLENLMIACSYDIFEALNADPLGADGTALAEIRDLRRYLLLIEAEMRARWVENTYLKEPVRKVGIALNKYIEETIGSPADGGHHARQEELEPVKILERLDDGLKMIPMDQRDNYFSTQSDGHGFHIVNRNKVSRECWEHLPLLAYELNNKEYEESPEYYRSLYRWIGTENKWRMQPQYRDNWGRS